MKNIKRSFGITALAVVVSLAILSCDDGGSSNNTLPGTLTIEASDNVTVSGGIRTVNTGARLIARYVGSGGQEVTYQWRRGNTDITNGTAAAYTANQAGTYTLVVSAPGFRSLTSNSITVEAGTGLPILDVTILANGKPWMKYNTYVAGTTFTAVVNNAGGAAVTYRWYEGATLVDNIVPSTNIVSRAASIPRTNSDTITTSTTDRVNIYLEASASGFRDFVSPSMIMRLPEDDPLAPVEFPSNGTLSVFVNGSSTAYSPWTNINPGNSLRANYTHPALNPRSILYHFELQPTGSLEYERLETRDNATAYTTPANRTGNWRVVIEASGFDPYEHPLQISSLLPAIQPIPNATLTVTRDNQLVDQWVEFSVGDVLAANYNGPTGYVYEWWVAPIRSGAWGMANVGTYERLGITTSTLTIPARDLTSPIDQDGESTFVATMVSLGRAYKVVARSTTGNQAIGLPSLPPIPGTENGTADSSGFQILWVPAGGGIGF